MTLKVFNNLSRSKETFSPIEAGKVKFYSCGPTTYDFLHIGNARALVVGDLFHRIFKSLGYEVNFVRNYTDVDDKIIERANSLGRDAIEHAAIFVDECRTDMDSLGMLPATHTPKVSETMPEIIEMIQDIIKNGYGYIVEGEVLYDVTKFKEYGKLSKKDLDGLVAGQRVEVDQKKKHPSDFVLWKPAKPGEPFWESPWGKGRPGWHIECSAMAKKFLGKTLDLHHGGVDLMFPHQARLDRHYPPNLFLSKKNYDKPLLGGQYIHIMQAFDLTERKEDGSYKIGVWHINNKWDKATYYIDVRADGTAWMEWRDLGELNIVPGDDAEIAEMIHRLAPFCREHAGLCH